MQLLRQFYRTGDLEGDGAVDTVVVLSVTDAGDESGQYIAVLRHLEMETISLGAERLGQVEVRDMRIEGSGLSWTCCASRRPAPRRTDASRL